MNGKIGIGRASGSENETSVVLDVEVDGRMIVRGVMTAENFGRLLTGLSGQAVELEVYNENSKTCRWSARFTTDIDYFDTECGKGVELVDANRLNPEFCLYCGGKIKI